MQYPNNSIPLYAVSEAHSDASDPRSDSNKSQPAIKHEAEASSERRDRSKPIPYNLSEYLNDDQQFSLRQMESFGWQLSFIRRPLFQEQVVVVANEDSSQYGVLEKDGSINMQAMIDLRH
ncbi:hypothetical protein [Teredinibacter franksiae]|uniref:hypothetical protein n=1 Tax=Teredinibacter franksiae TaxID=2761453 RepID=UPI0016284155|nr:hypothetical protein [Teredinibacter franksiae]